MAVLVFLRCRCWLFVVRLWFVLGFGLVVISGICVPVVLLFVWFLVRVCFGFSCGCYFVSGGWWLWHLLCCLVGCYVMPGGFHLFGCLSFVVVGLRWLLCGNMHYCRFG